MLKDLKLLHQRLSPSISQRPSAHHTRYPPLLPNSTHSTLHSHRRSSPSSSPSPITLPLFTLTIGVAQISLSGDAFGDGVVHSGLFGHEVGGLRSVSRCSGPGGPDSSVDSRDWRPGQHYHSGDLRGSDSFNDSRDLWRGQLY